MVRAYLFIRATSRSGCIPPLREGLGWVMLSFSSFLLRRKKRTDTKGNALNMRSLDYARDDMSARYLSPGRLASARYLSPWQGWPGGAKGLHARKKNICSGIKEDLVIKGTSINRYSINASCFTRSNS